MNTPLKIRRMCKPQNEHNTQHLQNSKSTSRPKALFTAMLPCLSIVYLDDPALLVKTTYSKMIYFPVISTISNNNRSKPALKRYPTGVGGKQKAEQNLKKPNVAIVTTSRIKSQLTEEKMEEFFHFWNDDFKFEHRELGCALQCMSRHFNLLTDSSRMHHDNTDKFIRSFPNGEILAKQMVELIHSCEKQFDDEQDHCWRILRVAECFKKSCQDKGIAPSMQMMMTEFIMESE